MHVQLVGSKVHVTLDRHSAHVLPILATMPFRRFDEKRQCWVLEYVRENFDHARQHNISLQPVPEPTVNASFIDVHKNGRLFVVRTPADKLHIDACRSIPEFRTWKPDLHAWVVKPTVVNIEHLQQVLHDIPWTDKAKALASEYDRPDVAVKAHKHELAHIAAEDYAYKTKPYAHQLTAFGLSRDATAYALFMEMGTGKTKVTIDNIGYLYLTGKIAGAVITCPKSIKSTWQEEIFTHMSSQVDTAVFVWESGKTKVEALEAWCTQHSHQCCIFIINIDAISLDRGEAATRTFLTIMRGRALMAIDESSLIKTPSAKRTKATIKLGQMASHRRILTGTPVTQSPLDVFTQFKFLDERILGFSSYYAFRNRFAMMGGFQQRMIVKYINIEELQGLVDPYSYRVTREECLDLPEKIFTKIYVELTPTQRKIYKDLTDNMEAVLNDPSGDKLIDIYDDDMNVVGHERVHMVNATIVLTQLLRLQQVVGGFLPRVVEDFAHHVDPYVAIPGGNPKIDALMDLLETVDTKVIIWANFRAEIDLIARTLRAKYGDEAVVEFHGGIKDADRQENRYRFQGTEGREHDPHCRFFVAQTATGGRGLTLTRAKTVVYFSNSFSLEMRLQSEDRTHRIGQDKNVMYFDLVARKTIDEKLVKTLVKKLNIANLITGDNFKDWI